MWVTRPIDGRLLDVRARENGLRLQNLVRVHEIDVAELGQLLLGVPEHLPEGGVRLAHADAVADHDSHPGALEDRLQPLSHAPVPHA